MIKPSKQTKTRVRETAKKSKPAEEVKPNNKARLASLVAKLNKTFGDNAVILGVNEKEVGDWD